MKEAQNKPRAKRSSKSGPLSRLSRLEGCLFPFFGDLEFLECSLCSVLTANEHPSVDFRFRKEFLSGEC